MLFSVFSLIPFGAERMSFGLVVVFILFKVEKNTTALLMLTISSLILSHPHAFRFYYCCLWKHFPSNFCTYILISSIFNKNQIIFIYLLYNYTITFNRPNRKRRKKKPTNKQPKTKQNIVHWFPLIVVAAECGECHIRCQPEW